MDKPKVILFYDLCRLCLENPGASDIFTADLTQDIFFCTGVKITSQDNLPRKICIQCLEIVVKAKQLRILASANETHLKSLFHDDEIFNITESNETEQSQSAEKSMSRRSSTDSDRTGNLVICEDENLIESNNKSKKRHNSSSCENSNCDAKKIAVRKDLFNSSSVTSSTTDSTSKKRHSKDKRLKSESDDGLGHECEVCQKKFSTWKKFYLHKKTHNRHILCPLDACGKKFATKGDLEKHIRTHTGERPYHCDICDRKFAQRGTLKAHRLAVHAKLVKTQDYIL